MRVKMVLMVGIMSCIVHSNLWGWGNGHDYVNRDTLTVMPNEIKTFLGKENQKKFIHWSHAPDTSAPFEKEKKKYPITDKEIEYLTSLGAKSLYSLHSSRKVGEGGNFILLIRAFMDKDPERSAFWMSTLLHTVADDAACNHTSQIHYLTYAFRKSKIKMGDGIGFDYANVAKTPEGRKIITLLLKNYKPQIISGSPDEVLEKILSDNINACTYGARKEYNIASTYAPNVTAKRREEGVKAMAELGIYGAKRGIDIIVTAWDFAKHGKIPILTPAIVKKAKESIKKQIAQSPLSDDSIYTGLLKKCKKGIPSIGILLERSKLMMSSKLSYGGRLVMAATMRTLKLNKIPYCTIDLRDLDIPNSKALNVKEIPLLILCSGSFHVSNNVKNNLKRYFNNGGRILWVGGRDKGLLGDLSKSLKKADPTMLPVTKKYGRNNTEVIDKIAIRFLPPFDKVLGDKEYKFINNPDTTAGHQKPLCLLKIEPINEYVKPLVELSVDNRTICIAGELMDKEGNVKAIFIPEYLLAPFLLHDTKDEVVNVADITLDKVGSSILLKIIKLMFQ